MCLPTDIKIVIEGIRKRGIYHAFPDAGVSTALRTF